MKLTKTFITKSKERGFENHLDIELDYNYEDGSLDNIEVKAWSGRRLMFTDLTDLFLSEPFYSIIDSIDWEEIYQQGIYSKEVGND